jgi:hypothetical protein
VCGEDKHVSYKPGFLGVFNLGEALYLEKTISSPRAFKAFLAFQSLLKVQEYMGSLSNVGFRLSNVEFRLFSLSVFSGCSYQNLYTIYHQFEE